MSDTPAIVMSGKCTAHTSSGKPCRNWALRGCNVCRLHGGSAPQVKRKALERIRALRDTAAAKFELQLDAVTKKNPDAVPPGVTFAAVRDLTKVVADLEERDRAGSVTSVVDEWLKSLRGGS